MSQIRSRTLLGMPAPNFAAEPFNLTRRAPPPLPRNVWSHPVDLPPPRRKIARCVRIHRDCIPPPPRPVEPSMRLHCWAAGIICWLMGMLAILVHV